MADSRTKNAARNAISGVFNRAVGLLIPFVLRTALIKVLGEQYLGLSNLFSSILQVLNLADLGFSSAIVYNMYKPIAEGDDQTVCALLNMYRKIYRVIGISILIVGLCLIPFLDKFISGDYPEGLNLTALYLMYLINTVASYLFFAYRKSLLSAFQRSDIETNINSITQIALDVVKLVLLFTLKNYYVYIFFVPLTTLVSGTITTIVSYRMYPQYRCIGTVDKSVKHEIVKRVSALAIQKFGNTISTSLDSIVVSSFLGLSLLAIYSNYFYIVSSLMAFIWVCISATTAGLGNSIVVDSIEKNYQNFKKLNMLNQWTICWCVPCLVCLYQHFMLMWVGENLTAGMDLAIYMTIYFLVGESRKVVMVFKDAAGMWWADKWKPIVGCSVNLFLNITSVQIIGINGVIISTIVSYLFVELPWETHVLFKNYFKISEKDYYIEMLKYWCLTFACTGISWCVCSFLPSTGFVSFCVKGCICVVVSNIMFYILYHNNIQFQQLKSLILGRFFIRLKKS